MLRIDAKICGILQAVGEKSVRKGNFIEVSLSGVWRCGSIE